MPNQLNSSPSHPALLCLCALLAFSGACNRQKSEPAPNTQSAKRYALKGKVVSIDKLAAGANIDTEPIAGFMDQMTMAYTIKPPTMLDQLQPGDSITADLIVEPDNKYWLENVKVSGHSKPTASKPTTQ